MNKVKFFCVTFCVCVCISIYRYVLAYVLRVFELGIDRENHFPYMCMPKITAGFDDNFESSGTIDSYYSGLRTHAARLVLNK